MIFINLKIKYTFSMQSVTIIETSFFVQVASEQSSEKCKTFVFMDEGYTLGNSLVAVITQKYAILIKI